MNRLKLLRCIALGVVLSAAIPVWAAFPAVQTRATSTTDTVTTVHLVTMPSGVVSGDLLIITIVVRGNSLPLTWNEGFTEILAKVEATGRITFGVGYKESDGTEGTDVEVTSSGSGRSAQSCYRITGHEDPTTQAPEATAGVDGLSTTPDPDSLTPTGGAEDFLWLAVHGHQTTATTDAIPTNYTDSLSIEASDDAAIGNGERLLNASSEDPGAFTVSASVRWIAATVAIHPVAGAADDDLMVIQ